MNGIEQFLDELAKIGLNIKSPWDLVNKPAPPTKAIPLLVEWLERAETEIAEAERQSFREALVRSLTIKQARRVATPALLKEFRRPEATMEYRWAVGNALEVVADETVANELIELARGRRWGQARQMVVLALARAGNSPELRNVLVELLQDEEVVGHAIMALGKLKNAESTSAIEKYLDHPNAWIRKEARKALAKLRSPSTLTTLILSAP